jgi:vancomycin aglycone glucosyltransferase
LKNGVPDWVRELFRASVVAAEGCELVVIGGELQAAGRSIAEHFKAPYVHATFCPVTLPSADHPPPLIPADVQWLPAPINRLLWTLSDRARDRLFRNVLNEQRQQLRLAPVSRVASHIRTDCPWVAADAALAPVPRNQQRYVQTGAWMLADPTPLPDELERFLANGEPPIYFGFGSMHAAPEASRIVVDTARALGRRAVILRGWANLDASDAGADCLLVGDVNHRRLFPRVAAIVHHGGAGTTTAAALSGRPQVIVSHKYDQYYWAARVHRMGIGVRAPTVRQLSREGLTRALRAGLQPAIVAAAAALAPRIETRGARIAAERLVADYARR